GALRRARRAAPRRAERPVRADPDASRRRRRPLPRLARRPRPATPRARRRARRGLVPLAVRAAFAVPAPSRRALPRRGRRRRRRGELRARGVELADVRRQLQLARPDLVPDERLDPRVVRALPPLPRRRLPRRMPDRLGSLDEPARGRRRASPAPDLDLPRT